MRINLWAKTLKSVLIIAKHGLADRVMGSSSMDFASEDGFETDDGAMTMYQYAIKLSGV